MFKQTEQDQKAGYMSQLDEWTIDNIVNPLSAVFESYGVDADNDVSQDEAVAKVDEVVEVVKKAIREKMLESYRNGQQASGRGGKRRYAGRK